jgi:hypothetical protein
MLAIDTTPTRLLDLAGERRSETAVPLGSATLLYGLSLAVALPPAAWRPPPNPAVPAIHPTAGNGLDLVAMTTALLQPVTELGCARIALGDLDRRLCGLSLALDLYRVGDGRGTLVPIGVIRQVRATTEAAGATPTDLWALARAAIPRCGVVSGRRPGLGDDAIIVRYGTATVQAAWLGADFLATVSATSLVRDDGRMIETVHTVAHLLAPGLEPQARDR